MKRQALYVLALSTQPRAYQILLNYAKGGGNPDLQLEAISYLTANRNKQTNAADLMAIYQSTQDTDVKLAIINALRTTRNQLALTNIMSSSNSPTIVRTSALNGLTGILSPQDLWTLYEKETNKDLKLQMVSAFGSMQAVDQLTRIVKSEKDPEVRRRALRVSRQHEDGEDGTDARRSLWKRAGHRGQEVDHLVARQPEQRRRPRRHRAQGVEPPAQDGNRPQAVGDGAAQQGGGGLSDGNH